MRLRYAHVHTHTHTEADLEGKSRQVPTEGIFWRGPVAHKLNPQHLASAALVAQCPSLLPSKVPGKRSLKSPLLSADGARPGLGQLHRASSIFMEWRKV